MAIDGIEREVGNEEDNGVEQDPTFAWESSVAIDGIATVLLDKALLSGGVNTFTSDTRNT